MVRLWRALRRGLAFTLRAFFILLLVVLPIPVGTLFHRLLDRGRRSEAAKVLKDEAPP